MISQEIIDGIKAFVMDVDGVLTDGRVGYGCGSDQEIKFFNIKDGCGIVRLRQAGITTAIISGRKSLANQRRASELKIDVLMEDCASKGEGMRRLCQQLEIEPRQCLYIGDDLIDIAAIRLAGIGVAVGDAVQEVKDEADWIMEAKGGEGAVREAAERLLKAKGVWKSLIAKFYD